MPKQRHQVTRRRTRAGRDGSYALGRIESHSARKGYYTVTILRGGRILLRHSGDFGTVARARAFGRRLVRSLNAGRGGVV